LMFLCGYQYACEARELPESEQEMAGGGQKPGFSI